MRRSALVGPVVALLMLCGAVDAQAQAIPVDQMAADRFAPAPGPDNYFALDGAVVGGHLGVSTGLMLDYSHRPLVAVASNCAPDDDEDCQRTEVELVEYEVSGSLMASLSLLQRVQIGLMLPVSRTEGDSFQSSTPNFDQPYVDLRGGRGFGLADPQLSVKARMVGRGTEGFSLALVAFVSAPLGQATAEDRFLGDDGVGAGGHLAAELRMNRFRVAANLGGAYRPDAQVLAIEVGPEMRYGVGGSFEVTPLLRVLGELVGSTGFGGKVDSPLELRAGGELSVADFAVKLAAGSGLVKGVGAPDFRVLAGVGFEPLSLDGDRDGIDDAKDACPTEPEDEDGFQDDDGCPDSDNDADGLDDLEDKCPNEPEDPDGTEDQDGCPDRDNDGDGIEDGYDSCPDEAEDKDGDRDEDGCPDNDRDRDGIPDDVDKCPDVEEDTDGFGDEDGCPESDFDGDNIPDVDDLCPEEPEDLNGVEDEDGCPETPSEPQAPAEEPPADATPAPPAPAPATPPAEGGATPPAAPPQ